MLRTFQKAAPARIWAYWALMAMASAPAPAQDAARTAPLPLDPVEAERLAPEAAGSGKTQVTLPYNREESERLRVIRTAAVPETSPKGGLRIKALEGFFDYDEAEQIFYAPGRTQIWYGDFFLEADRVILDNRLQEVQAEGNVIFRNKKEALAGTEIHADSMRYNFGEGEGVAYNVSGKHPPMFFKAPTGKEGDPAPFQKVSEAQSLFRNTSVTTCDFKKPHFSIRGREVILFNNDRVFFRGATLRVWDVPVFYLPYYSRSLVEKNPWYFQAGMGSETGFRLRVGYISEHRTEEPSFENDSLYETRSEGTVETFADILSKRGFGAGARYTYDLDFGRHKGEFQAYGMRDSEREVSPAAPDEDNDTDRQADRWQYLWRNRTELGKHLYATANVDWFSDPEIFYDALDFFQEREFQRERQMTRQARGAITYLREAYVARMLLEVKDRAGLDRYNNFSDPSDNNLDYEFDPGVSLEETEANSIGTSRWGRVTERKQFTAATRYLPFRRWPLHAMGEVNIYNNLDKGLNTVDERDDANVKGIDAYSQALWQYRITERYVVLAKLGAGMGLATRDDDDLGVSPPAPGVPPPVRTPFADYTVDGLTIVDRDDTFLVGRERFNLEDIDPFYAWGDSEIRFNARFSDALTGHIMWKFRETTNNFIGDFYAKVGNITSRQDLFNYKLRENLAQGNLTYRLLHPNVQIFANAGKNLVPTEDQFPNEQLGFWNTGTVWTNRRGTLRASAVVGWTERAIRAASDPLAGDQATTFYSGDVRFSPLHGRWYGLLRYTRSSSTGTLFEDDIDQQFTFFSDQDSRDRVEVVYGVQLGPKWSGEFGVEWDSEVEGLRKASLLLQRDLHDAVLAFKLRSRRDITQAESRYDNVQELDFSFGIKFKLPHEDEPLGTKDIRTARKTERQPMLSY